MFFVEIVDAAAIVVSKGVYRQTKVFVCGGQIYVKHGSGYIYVVEAGKTKDGPRIGTSVPHVRVEKLHIPASVKYGKDALGRYHIK